MTFETMTDTTHGNGHTPHFLMTYESTYIEACCYSFMHCCDAELHNIVLFLN